MTLVNESSKSLIFFSAVSDATPGHVFPVAGRPFEVVVQPGELGSLVEEFLQHAWRSAPASP
jgi:hypothetical protein